MPKVCTFTRAQIQHMHNVPPINPAQRCEGDHVPWRGMGTCAVNKHTLSGYVCIFLKLMVKPRP